MFAFFLRLKKCNYYAKFYNTFYWYTVLLCNVILNVVL